MDNAATVRVRQPPLHLGSDADRLRDRQPPVLPLAKKPIEIPSCHVLRDDLRLPRIVSNVEHRDDVRVIAKPSHRLRLPTNADESIGVHCVLPFQVVWLLLAPPLGALRSARDVVPKPGRWLLAVWLICGTLALLARSIVFGRPLFSAFFIVALLGDGLSLFAWRTIPYSLITNSVPS